MSIFQAIPGEATKRRRQASLKILEKDGMLQSVLTMLLRLNGAVSSNFGNIEHVEIPSQPQERHSIVRHFDVEVCPKQQKTENVFP